MITVGETAFGAAEFVLLVKGETGHHVKAVLAEIALAHQYRAAMQIAAGILGDIGKGGQFDAGKILAQNKVDDAADRIGTVNCRGAVFKHLNALHGRERNRIQVDRIALGAVC